MGKITPLTKTRLRWRGRDGDEYRFRRRGPGTITITYSTYVGGMALGAMHYYCRVRADRPDVFNITEGRSYSMAGYGPECPNLDAYHFDAERVITKFEKDLSGQKLGDIGETTGRFNDPHEAVRAGIEVTLANFADTKRTYWIVHFNYCGDDLEGVDFRLSDLEDIDAIMERVEFYG